MLIRRLTSATLAVGLLLGLTDSGGQRTCRASDRASPSDTSPREKIVRVEKSDAQWRRQLTRKQFEVSRRGGTERPFSGKLWDNKRPGVYRCVCCDLELFSSKTKFESATGWPSFWRPIDESHFTVAADRGNPSELRIEVICARCDAHLGHVFDDGPPPTGLRFCINSTALRFVENPRAVPGRRE